MRKEIDKRGYSVETKSVIREINSVEFGERKECGNEVRECRWDL